MKAVLLFLSSLFFTDSGQKYLSQIPSYQRDSYFKEEVYAEHSWQSFYQLKEINSIIQPDDADLHLLNAAVYFATNKLRAEKKLPVLKFHAGLRDAAFIHSQQMIEKNFFNHINHSSLKLRAPDGRIKLFVTGFRGLGENIDWNSIAIPSDVSYVQLADKLVDAWYHSPPHRKTMLSKQFSHLGCAAMFETRNKNGIRYVKATQDFSLQTQF
jgi:uncharacterized protein YkwD